MNKQKSLPVFVYWLFVGYFSITYIVLALGEKISAIMLPEDHYFENVGAGSLFIASILFFYIFFISLRIAQKPKAFLVKQLVFLGLGMLFFFGAGEEISWGQRIFNINTPAALNQVNTQNELNIHNLSVFEESKFFTADRMFDIFWFSFFVLVPVFSYFFKKFKDFIENLMPILPLALSGLFVLNYIWAQISKKLYVNFYNYEPIPFVQAVQEIKESNYSLLFIVAGLLVLWNMQSLGKAILKGD